MEQIRMQAIKLIKNFYPFVSEYVNSTDSGVLMGDDGRLYNAKECALRCIDKMDEERNRAIEICQSYNFRSTVLEESMRGNDKQIIYKEKANEARLIGNTIRDTSYLVSQGIKETYFEQLRIEINNIHLKDVTEAK